MPARGQAVRSEKNILARVPIIAVSGDYSVSNEAPAPIAVIDGTTAIASLVHDAAIVRPRIIEAAQETAILVEDANIGLLNDSTAVLASDVTVRADSVAYQWSAAKSIHRTG